MADAKKEKIKNLVRKLKRKKKQILGQVHIPGVTHPQKRAKGEVKEAKHAKHKETSKPKRAKKQVLVGPKGGQYIQTSGGKRKYAEKAKKSLEAFIENDEILNFINEYRSKKNG